MEKSLTERIENPYQPPMTYHQTDTQIPKNGISDLFYPFGTIISEYYWCKYVETQEWGAPFEETFWRALPSCIAVEFGKAYVFSLGVMAYTFLR